MPVFLSSCSSKANSDELVLCSGECTVTTQTPSFLLVERPFGAGAWFVLARGDLLPISPPVGAKPLYYNGSQNTLISSRVEKTGVTLFVNATQKEEKISFPRNAVLLSACQTKEDVIWVLYLDQKKFPVIKGVVSIFPLHQPDDGKSYLLSGGDRVVAKMRARAGMAMERVPVTLICQNKPLIVMDEMVSDLAMIHLYSFDDQKRVLQWKSGLSEVSRRDKISVRMNRDGLLQLFNGSSLTTLDAPTGFPLVEHFDDEGEMLFSQDPEDDTMLFIPKHQNDKQKVARKITATK